ncbi:MAG: ADP-ribosylglycohydrolase family protein [Myxococcales bacterium]|nr:ADP-ribosylglycohydrolase family protein [Myxococcales bacterium]
MDLDTAAGALLGLGIGDALGYAVEFRRRTEILDALGPMGVTGFLSVDDPRLRSPGFRPVQAAGTWSDDTQMTIALAEGLLDAGRDASLDRQMEAVGRRFVAWLHSPDNDRAPGRTCIEGCRALERGVPWRDAGVAGSKGCGSAMRVAPIGLLWVHDLDRVEVVARSSSLLTHGHPAALEGAAAAALLVALAARGAHPAEAYAEVQRRCGGRSPDFDARWAQVPRLLDAPPAVALSRAGLGEGWVAEEAVASAMYCAWRHPDDFVAGVLEATNTDGDSDSLAAIAGSVLGARLGRSALPAAWITGLEDAPRLDALAAALCA